MVNDFLLNKVSISPNQKYCSIIGLSPSKGARSPVLWNHCYQSFDNSTRMYPFDVSGDNLIPLLDFLAQDPNFLGSAIAVPYKSAVYDYLRDSVDPTVTGVKAVNCLLRRDQSESLYGLNTDGHGFILSLKEVEQNLTDKKVGLIGNGGTARAIFPYLLREASTPSQLHTFSRTLFPRLAHGVNHLSITDIASKLSDLDIIINCTTVGSILDPHSTLVPLDTLSKLKPSAIVCDVIYQPLESNLLKDATSLGLRTLNGLRMNLLQAALGFHMVNPYYSLEKVSSLMQQI